MPNSCSNRGAQRRRRSPLAAILGVALAVTSAQALGETLEDALALAYQSNPTLVAERARLRASDEGVARALSGWRPQITLSGGFGKATNNSSTGISRLGHNRDPRNYSVVLTQNIWKGGQTEADVARAKNQVRADQAWLLNTEQVVLFDGVTAYVDVVRDVAVLDLNANLERVIGRQLEAARDRFRVGEVTRTDVAQAESRLSRARADRIRAEGQLITSRAAYQRVMGQAPGKLEPAPPLNANPADEALSLKLAREQNFAVRQTQSLEKAAGNQVDLTLGELFPVVTLNGEYSESWESTSKRNQSDEASIIARVTVPLYESGLTRAKAREAKESVVGRRHDSAQTLRDVLRTVTQAWAKIETARAQITSFTAAVRATEIALDGVQQESLVGSRTILDVLDAEQELLNARVSLVTAQRDDVVATYDLKAAIGELTAERLGLKVEIYDFLKNYDAARSKWFTLGVGGE